jgi:hypothetical protein
MRCAVTVPVSTAADGATALAVLLRWMRPSCSTSSPEPGSGCAAIRARGDDTPILMLMHVTVSRPSPAGRKRRRPGCRSLEELRARLRFTAARRRSRPARFMASSWTWRRTRHAAAAAAAVPKTEFALLSTSATPAGSSRTPDIRESVWGTTSARNRTGSGSISYLRRKMQSRGLIQTVRGIGYVLREEA